ncbi:MAG: hypothetical protein GWO24_21140, partial [Akkermansiaceae bacterium]|nr:hypothetical protein [Akkermansiaceae bacterium]
LAGHLYFSDRGTNRIYRSDFHGNNREELFNADDFPASIPGPKRFRGLVADPQRGFVFFCDSTENMVLRGTIATREIVALVKVNQRFPADITMDHAGGKIYWCNRTNNLIQRADLDGSDVEDLVEAPSPYFLQLDLASSRIYFGDFSAGNIFRADLADGNNLETLVSGITGQVRGVHFDPSTEMLYWANRNDGKIQRRPVQGTAEEIEDLYT